MSRRSCRRRSRRSRRSCCPPFPDRRALQTPAAALGTVAVVAEAKGEATGRAAVRAATGGGMRVLGRGGNIASEDGPRNPLIRRALGVGRTLGAHTFSFHLGHQSLRVLRG